MTEAATVKKVTVNPIDCIHKEGYSICSDGRGYAERMDRRPYSLRVRLLEQEHARIEQYAKEQGLSVSEVIRDFIKALPVKSEPALRKKAKRE